MRLSLKIAVAAIACFLTVSLPGAAIPPGYTGVPFCCDTLKRHYQQIPGQVVMVFFDSGGEGVGFHYAGSNQGGSMRSDASGNQIQADFKISMQAYSGNDYDMITDQHEVGYWHLAWMEQATATDPGEWTKYSVHVNTAGMYYVSFHQATAYNPNLEVLTYYDGLNVKSDSVKNLPICAVPPGCPEVWHSWTINQNVDSVLLDTGLQVIQVSFLIGSWNFDLMNFDLHYPTQVERKIPVHLTEPDAMKVRPMESMLRVSFDLKQAGKESFSIMDCSGKLVGNPVATSLGAGPQSQSLPLGKLAPGVYFLQMENNGIMVESRFLITR